jgi:DNA (cytosine-5)-methyltransferase 1
MSAPSNPAPAHVAVAQEKQLRVLDLCSGVGSYSLGLERTGGFRTVAFCEIEPFCRRILAKHWPGVRCFHDLKQLKAGHVGEFDGIIAGFPCTDISEANQGAAGLDGEHSSLWFEVERLLEEVGRPLDFVILENSTRLRSRGLDRVLRSLDALGYDAEWHCLTARAFNAPHERDRLWIVAYPHGFPEIGPTIARQERPAWAGEPDVPRVAHGIADQPHRRHAIGNTNPPVVPEIIGQAFLEIRCSMSGETTAFNAGAEAFRAGHKLYGAENRQPTKKLRRLWRDGWLAARDEARAAA